NGGKQPADFWFFAATILLVVVGILLVFDSSFARAGDSGLNDPYYFVKRQIVYAAIGFLALLAMMKISPEKYRSATIIMLAISLILLALVLVPGVGKSIAGARRWIPIGPFHLQPSELAKLALVMYLADRLAAKGLRIRNLSILVPNVLVVGLIAGLIIVEPDMGTASAVVFTAAAMFYAAGVKKRHMIGLVGIGALFSVVMILIEPYRLQRVITFLEPGKDYYGSGYQVTHALIAVATGGLTGVGLCEGREKFYLPAPQTDMIGPTLAEELGFIGMLFLLGLFILFTYRGLCIGHKAKSSYMGLLALGITSMISVQALVNVAVFTASMPATGVPLPFISYGGSHLIAMLIGAGMVLSVSRHLNVKMKEPELEEYENRVKRRRDRRSHLSCTEYRPASKRVRRRTPVRR
ncbi:MAG TPA: putative lipid II flippase FtsW, partial [Armatimonadota bacterium]|nr:putative lipid II flippase FtsW [Armatimonadota bacterium]